MVVSRFMRRLALEASMSGMSKAVLSHFGGFRVNNGFFDSSLKLNRGRISPETEMIVSNEN